jgi:large subunit ribosomal protein L6
MSRIGKLPIVLPSGVSCSFTPDLIEVSGPKGKLSLSYEKKVLVKQEDMTLVIERNDDSKESRAYHGLYRTLIANMVEGVSKGYEKRLEINGVGYRAQATGSHITISLGFSHPIEMDTPEGVTVTMNPEVKNEIIVSGFDKQKVGQFAANIRTIRKIDPYKGKGIKYVGEYIRRKAGKTVKK